HLAGGAAAITDANALSLGTLDLASLEATSHGNLDLGSGSVAGGLVARSNGGVIGQSGALRVGGTSELDAGTGALVLEHAGNDFVGAVAATGAGVSLFDANDLLLASINGGGPVSLVAGGNLTLPAQAIDAGGADLRLAALGGTLSTRGPLSGGDVSLQGRDGI